MNSVQKTVDEMLKANPWETRKREVPTREAAPTLYGKARTGDCERCGFVALNEEDSRCPRCGKSVKGGS